MAPPKVEIYTTMFCPYCHAAKRLLKKKGVVYSEIDVTMNQQLRQAMMERAGGRHSVPQIFIGSTHVGGSDELHALDAKGELNPLLASQTG